MLERELKELDIKVCNKVSVLYYKKLDNPHVKLPMLLMKTWTLMMLSPFPKASLFHFQGASKRTERDQLSDDRQYQIKQRTKLELDMKDLKDIVDDDSSVKVSPANSGEGHL